MQDDNIIYYGFLIFFLTKDGVPRAGYRILPKGKKPNRPYVSMRKMKTDKAAITRGMKKRVRLFNNNIPLLLALLNQQGFQIR